MVAVTYSNQHPVNFSVSFLEMDLTIGASFTEEKIKIGPNQDKVRKKSSSGLKQKNGGGRIKRKRGLLDPYHPLKPTLPRTEPICADGEGNQLSQANFLQTSSCASPHASYTDSVVACAQSSSGAGLHMKMHDQVESTSAVTSIGGDSAGACAKPTAVPVSDLEGVSFSDLLALADAASIHYGGTDPGTNNEGKNPLFPDSSSQSDSPSNLASVSPTPHNGSLEETLVNTINYIPQETQGTSSSASQTNSCYGKTISHLAPPTPDKAIRGESRQVVGMQVYVELEKNVPSTNSETPDDRELSEAVTESSLAAVSMPLKENHNPDKGGSHVVDLNQTPTPKQRRKKHRPKVIKEGKPNSTRKPVTSKPAQPKENPTCKRKYVRKKGLNKASTPPPTEVTVELTESIMPGSTKKSCRRSLNFELTEQPGGETTVPRENVTLHIGKGSGLLEETHTAPNTPLANINTSGANSAKNWKRKGVVTTTQDGLEKSETQRSLNFELTDQPGGETAVPTENVTLHVGKGSGVLEETHTAPNTPLANINTPGANCAKNWKRKGVVTTTQDGHGKYETQSSQNNSNSSKTGNLTTGSHMGGTKRKHSATTDHADISHMNLIGVHYNGLHAYQRRCVQFPAVQKKRRIENPVTFEATDGATHDRSQAFESLISFSQTRPTKRRSKAPTKFRDFATLTFTSNCSILPNQFTRQRRNSYMQTLVDGERPITSIDTLVAENMHASFKKKRSTRENRKKRAISTFVSTTQMHHDFLLNGCQPSWTMSLDTANIMQKVEALTEKFRHLHINVRASSSHELKALIPYKQKNQKGMITQGDGRSFHTRDINSHGIDGTDEEKAKWWEEERRVFRGRADSFIARMHLVQGDRRFSQWKGSVVDSVVGVFLTQNVSDHLSSSAFMSLVARFPLKESSKCKIYQEESTSLFANEPLALIIEPKENTNWDDKILSQPVCCQSSLTKDITEHSEEKEALNSNDSPGTTSLADESDCILLKSKEYNTREHPSTMSKPTGIIITQARQEKPCYGETQKELADIVSSQCSAISSQISGGFSVDQNSEKIVSCSDSNSEAEDLSSIAKLNIMDNTTRSSKLLEIATSTKLHEVNSMRTKSSENLKAASDLSFGMEHDKQSEDLEKSDVIQASLEESMITLNETGMNNMLAGRIQDFLNRLVEEHGGIDLEWLRDVPPDEAKEYLLSIRGLGLKSVECVRLLTLHHLAFPVDTNVGRIAVRLGWVPLQPLPESLQLHLLELYPVLESIQKYLWPRLCKLDQRTLYELHYQMITFGKVFCTKSKPNCNACPMRGECRHFASAFASARLALPGPEQRSIVSTAGNNESDKNPSVIVNQLPLPLPANATPAEDNGSDQNPSVIVGQLPLPLPSNTTPTEENEQKRLEANSGIVTCEPIIEEPATPERECTQILENDIEDAFYEDTCEIPTIKLNIEEFNLNLQNYMQENMELQGGMSKALVALNPEAASIPTPKLKNVSRLRTEHNVYELPDSHPLLEGWERRELDDPCKYLLAIWTPGETADSIQPPESRCSFQGDGQLCNERECFSCNSIREADSQIVRGTILIPCRTAMRGSFPLNGTYFQVNEVFADHVTIYFGTSVPSIFKGLSTPEIQQCFWRGFVCVRGFERETRAPRPLMARLHFPASRLARTKEKSSGK
ncbi:hypothetical protein K1719_031835 [Acacia pycnantha]|nr:hypothetical protein K1719_031835 [Acacia pycnantha]